MVTNQQGFQGACKPLGGVRGVPENLLIRRRRRHEKETVLLQ
jgi:hypothetical protein